MAHFGFGGFEGGRLQVELLGGGVGVGDGAGVGVAPGFGVGVGVGAGVGAPTTGMRRGTRDTGVGVDGDCSAVVWQPSAAKAMAAAIPATRSRTMDPPPASRFT
jgi:hypothetical protein